MLLKVSLHGKCNAFRSILALFAPGYLFALFFSSVFPLISSSFLATEFLFQSSSLVCCTDITHHSFLQKEVHLNSPFLLYRLNPGHESVVPLETEVVTDVSVRPELSVGKEDKGTVPLEFHAKVHAKVFTLSMVIISGVSVSVVS